MNTAHLKTQSPRRNDYWIGEDGAVYAGKPDEHGRPPYGRELTDEEWDTHKQTLFTGAVRR